MTNAATGRCRFLDRDAQAAIWKRARRAIVTPQETRRFARLDIVRLDSDRLKRDASGNFLNGSCNYSPPSCGCATGYDSLS